MITVDEIKQILPDDLLTYLTDETGTGVIDEAKLQEIVNNANEYFAGKMPNAPESVRDEAARNYVIARLYAYVGNIDLATTYMQFWQRELEAYFAEVRTRVWEQQVRKSDTTIAVSSNERVFTDEELDLW